MAMDDLPLTVFEPKDRGDAESDPCLGSGDPRPRGLNLEDAGHVTTHSLGDQLIAARLTVAHLRRGTIHN
jgi:hypothetical protein